jgi:hypothetical protein
MRHIFLQLLLWCWIAHASTIQYYGYDFIDYPANVSGYFDAQQGFADAAGPTTMNIVGSPASLNYGACAKGACALYMTAGAPIGQTNSSGFPIDDVCPGSVTWADCSGVANANIARYVESIASTCSFAGVCPGAIYFIDEPTFLWALQTSDRVYVPGAYAGLLDALHRQLSLHNLSLPVFTVIGRSQVQDAAFVQELQSLDWIGIDDYVWSIDNDSQQAATNNDPSVADVVDMLNTYNRVAPSGSPKWLLVPPSTPTVIPGTPADCQLDAHIRVYAEFLADYPSAPVVAVMNFRLDPTVTAAAYPASHADLVAMAENARGVTTPYSTVCQQRKPIMRQGQP